MMSQAKILHVSSGVFCPVYVMIKNQYHMTYNGQAISTFVVLTQNSF